VPGIILATKRLWAACPAEGIDVELALLEDLEDRELGALKYTEANLPKAALGTVVTLGSNSAGTAASEDDGLVPKAFPIVPVAVER